MRLIVQGILVCLFNRLPVCRFPGLVHFGFILFGVESHELQFFSGQPLPSSLCVEEKNQINVLRKFGAQGQDFSRW